MAQSAVPASVVAELVVAAREYLRLQGGVEAALLTRAAAAAFGLAEAFCGVAVVRRLHEDVLPATGGWQRLRARPVTAIAGVTALPVAAAPFVLAVDAYAIDIDADGDGWLQVADAGGAGRVAVDYTAGLAADWAAVPMPVAQGLVMLVAHLFEHRDGIAQPPAAVAALWRPFRRMKLMTAVR
ncbi:head-tail connector protein [Sphingomonas sp.]|jgi:uncharacterized phiE125 gp8 family phage protein|uniref:head-tail connector protein n=1 Tax=Sphingomonas sp. TaxID=28214 RepID=UPI002D7F8C3B|nr:hypothetical protein [Sphingomonas sp.]HEU0043850.1 hypothetical protein [Sphingomonas sp.]